MLSADFDQMAKIKYARRAASIFSSQAPTRTLFAYSGHFDPSDTAFAPCQVYLVSHCEFAQGFAAASDTQNLLSIFYIYRGAVSLSDGNSIRTAGTSSVILSQSGNGLTITQSGDEPLELLVLRCGGYLAKTYYSLLPSQMEHLSVLSREKADPLIEKIIFCMKYPTRANSALLTLTMTQLFSILLLDASDQPLLQQPEWFLSAVSYMEQNYDKDITVAKIASELGISPSYFHRLFCTYTSVTPYQYILQIRVSRAKELLANPMLQIKYISRAVGFHSENHFITHFKKLVGMTPGEYRKSRIRLPAPSPF